MKKVKETPEYQRLLKRFKKMKEHASHDANCKSNDYVWKVIAGDTTQVPDKCNCIISKI